MRCISPSLMCLEREDELAIQFLCEKADYMHFDIMDSDFSSCSGLDPHLLEKFKNLCNPKFDVHIMSQIPLQHIKYCIKKRCDIISFHVESEVNIRASLDLIHNAGLMSGLAIKPDTNLDALTPYLSYVDLINVMLVNPGPAGQDFQKRELNKVIELRKIREKNNYKYLIEIDGSCNKKHFYDIDSVEPDILVVGKSGLVDLDANIKIAWAKMQEYMTYKPMIYLHADLVGSTLKNSVKEWLVAEGFSVQDLYANGNAEYPECARELSYWVNKDKCNKGILFCGTRIGMSIVANKVKGIRAAVVTDCYSAKMAREHNDANVLCLGSRVVTPQIGIPIVQTFLNSNFLFGKHAPRVDRFEETK